MRCLPALLLAIVLALAACQAPPPEAYVGGGQSGAGIALGRSAAGDECTQQRGGGPDTAYVYCGDWDQPAGSVRVAAPATEAGLATLATSGSWRAALEYRLTCAAPERVSLVGAPALLLRCSRKVGGWPYVAFAVELDGRTYLAEGIVPILPVLERSVGVLAKRLPAASAATMPPSRATALLIDRLAARAFRVQDVADYDRLMALGARANLSEDFAAAAKAYRAALALQQKALGPNNPNTAVAMMSLALQLSDAGQFGAADALFAKSETLAPGAADQAAPARLLHYRALHQLNQSDPQQALSLLDAAERGYASLVPPEAVAAVVNSPEDVDTALLPSERVLTDPIVQSALMGMVEARRYRAVALRATGDRDAAVAAVRKAERLASANALIQPIVGARVARTAALSGVRSGMFSTAPLDRSASDFKLALPLTRPVAATGLLRAAAALRDGNAEAALRHCRTAVALLRTLKAGVEPALLEPCLTALAAEAGRRASDRQATLAEMLEVAELAQGSVTSELIAEAAARLAEGARDPRVATAIRRRQDAAERLSDLYRERDTQAEARRPGGLPYDGPRTDAADLDRQIAERQAELTDSDQALQVASPNYGQLVQQIVPVADVLAALRPGEAFAGITLVSDGAWVFLLRDGRITLGHGNSGTAAMARLTQRVRASLRRRGNEMPDFDFEAAHKIYDDTLGTVGPQLEGIGALVVAPSGALLSLPFAVLATGPFDGDNLAAAPWLIRKASVAHVPSAANFVALRRASGGSGAARAWIGFGDFRPVTLAQATRSFPGPACAETAKEFAGLPALAFSRKELDEARTILGGSAAELRTGPAFTAAAVRKADLKDYRIVHFSTHALLPAELQCQPQPFIATSDPPGAADASGAMLLADDVLGIELDADAVILSACNSGGRGNKLSGESLSALARAFFYGGARALLATHWNLNDEAGERLVADLLRQYAEARDGGLATALRTAQLGMMDGAAEGKLPAWMAHPAFWGPMALIGDGGGLRRTAERAAPPRL